MCTFPEFRERINELLQVSGCKTAVAFAEKVGISRQSMGFYLNGDRVPDSKTLRQICVTCGVSADWLLGLSDVRKADVNLRGVAEYTGLSEAAIDELSDWSGGRFAETINLLLSSSHGLKVLSKLSAYVTTDFSHMLMTATRQRIDTPEAAFYFEPIDGVFDYFGLRRSVITTDDLKQGFLMSLMEAIKQWANYLSRENTEVVQDGKEKSK